MLFDPKNIEKKQYYFATPKIIYNFVYSLHMQ